MIHKTISALFSNLNPKPMEYQPSEVMDAFRKVDRILDTAVLPEHVDTAERMFANMLRRYGMNNTEPQSPLVVGMQTRINTLRHSWSSMEEAV